MSECMDGQFVYTKPVAIFASGLNLFFDYPFSGAEVPLGGR